MLVMVTGGSASGKSTFAEKLLCGLWSGPKLYLATMRPYGEEGEARIKKHRKMRFGLGFETWEEYGLLSKESCPGKEYGVLFECVSNYTANFMFGQDEEADFEKADLARWEEEAAEEIADSILQLSDDAGLTVAVTCEVFSDGLAYGKGTESFIRVLSRVNRRIAGAADSVYETVCGIPFCLKGEELCI